MVLIVEDEAVSRRALQTLLRIHGYTVTAVGSGEDALRLVSTGQVPDVAVVDVNLPGMSGVEFIRRARFLHPKMPCIFMSANDEVNLEQIREVFREPALRKPFEVSNLLRLIGRFPSLPAAHVTN
jgi:CheY-like chemotaxis protein